jgi:signal transduction histidine kinase/HPt (histidine-containing phosphotransfer) domain-containing protein
MWRFFSQVFGDKTARPHDSAYAAGAAEPAENRGWNEKNSRALAAAVSNEGIFSNISAELRTPLTLMLAPLESLLMGEHGSLSERQRRLLKTVHNNAVKLLQMISGLLDFSKLEAGTLDVNRQPVDVIALTRATIEDFHGFANRKNIRLNFAHQSPHAVANLDRYLLERIVFNLLSNALKFTSSGGEVLVTVELVGDRLILQVKDTGVGISEREQLNIFSQFHHDDDGSTRRSEGMGLGLSLVREFAVLLGGQVTVESKVGHGSTFTVDVLAPPAGGAATASYGTADGEEMGLRQYETITPEIYQEGLAANSLLPKVLIADNNAELAGYVADLLSEQCQTCIATDGEQAFGLVCDWRPDLVLTGVVLSRRDGLSLCRAIKAKPETAMTPVVLLTALTQRDAMVKGWEAGADEYLFKPFHPAELVTRIRSLLRSVQQRRKAQEQIERLNEALERRVIELAEANKELKSLANKLEQARDQALEASRFKSVFLANMSHEIRTPINGVISMSDMLTRTTLSAEQGEIANIIRDSAGSLLDIINDILDFSKIEAGKLELEIVDFELSNIIEGTAELVAEQARAKKLSLMTCVSREIPEILRGDPGRLRQILLNLLSNAIKFTSGGEVLVEVALEYKEEQRCRVRISVTDTGIGMAQETVHRLFQPFTQADGSITRKYGGTGLGLSIAKLLVELLGGRIGVRSVEGKGSTFWFSVPLDYPKEAHPPQWQMAGNLADTRVLVVDPLKGTARVFLDYLSDAVKQVDHAENGAQALEMMHQQAQTGAPYDVALVELHLPDMLSFVLANKVEDDEQLRKTKLILCTAADEERLGETALQAGFTAYLIKPVKRTRLLDCIALVLDKDAQPIAETSATRIQRLMTTGEFSVIKNVGMILVAEDNPVNQKVATLLLKELGFSAHVVANGREALEAVGRAPYSIILMDCQMPDMDGFEATGAIRRGETLTGKHIPIIAMTAHAMQGDREKCIAAGMDDYVSKPVTAAKLKEVLLRWFKPDSNRWRGAREPMRGAVTMPTGGESKVQNGSTPQEPDAINMQALESACGSEGARELLEIFVHSTDDLFGRMNAALSAKDAKQLKSCAHEMKGACASIGAQDMAAISKNIEASALAENWADSGNLVRDLQASFVPVRAFCQRILQSSSPAG